jgi:hypothetical protein
MTQVIHAYNSPMVELTGTVTVFNSAGAPTTIAATNLVGPNEWESTHQVTYFMTGNTSNVSTISGTNIIWAASGNVSLSATSNTLGILAASPVYSFFEVPTPIAQTFNVAGGGGWLIPQASSFLFLVPFSVPVQYAEFVMLSQLVPTWNTLTTGTGQASAGYSVTVGLYSQGTVGSSSLYSLSVSSSITFSASQNSNSMSFGVGGSASTSFSVSGANTSVFTGNKWLQIPFGTANAVEFWTDDYLWAWSMSSAGSAAAYSFNNIAIPYATSSQLWGLCGPTIASNQFNTRTDYDRIFGGVWSTTSAAFPASIATNAITVYTNAFSPICQFVGS